MRRRRFNIRLFTWTIAALSLGAHPASAQSLLDTLVGQGQFGRPLISGGMIGHELGALSRATGVPVGFEQIADARMPPRRAAVTLSGLTLRAALDAVVPGVARYESREMDGVVVLRPNAYWDGARSPLDAAVPPVKLRHTNANKMLELAASLLGGPNFGNQFSDTKRLPLNLEQGTLLDLLNATVRAHGDLVWQFEPNVTPQGLPYMLSFISGHSGYGQGVTLRPAARDLDMTRFEAVPADETGNPVPFLNRIVGLRPDGMPLTLHGPYSSSIRDLATATTTLFGFESAPRVDTPKLAEIAVSGRSLGEVLNALMAVDDRYEWREMNGVIVVRPRTAWSDADSPLFRLVPGFRIDDVTVGDVVAKAAVSLGGGPEELVTFPDSLRMSVEVPAGTVLELLNATVRSHGQLSWSYEPAPPDAAKRTGLAHVLTSPSLAVAVRVSWCAERRTATDSGASRHHSPSEASHQHRPRDVDSKISHIFLARV